MTEYRQYVSMKVMSDKNEKICKMFRKEIV